MPDAEQRRQRAAFYAGLFRATAVASCVIVLLVGAFLFAFYQWRIAAAAQENSESNERTALHQLELANIAQQAAEAEKLKAKAAERRALDKERLANEARDAERIAKADLEKLVASEMKLRKEAETREMVADQLRRQATESQQAAVASEKEALRLQELAENSQSKLLRQTELAKQRATDAQEALRRMQIAYNEMRSAQDSTAAVSNLIAQVPDWLQTYAAQAVSKHAETLIADGKREEALQTYAPICRNGAIRARRFLGSSTSQYSSTTTDRRQSGCRLAG